MDTMNNNVHREEDPMADSKGSVFNWLCNQVNQLDTDLIRDMPQCITEYLVNLETNELCGADHGEKSPSRAIAMAIGAVFGALG